MHGWFSPRRLLLSLLESEAQQRRVVETQEKARHAILQVEWGTCEPTGSVLTAVQQRHQPLQQHPKLQAITKRKRPASAPQPPYAPCVLPDANLVGMSTVDSGKQRLAVSSLLLQNRAITAHHDHRTHDARHDRARGARQSVDNCQGARPLLHSAGKHASSTADLMVSSRMGIVPLSAETRFLSHVPATTLERVSKGQQLAAYLVHHPDYPRAPEATWSRYRFCPGWAETKAPPPPVLTEEQAAELKLRKLETRSTWFTMLQQKAELITAWQSIFRQLQAEARGEKRRIAATDVQKITRGRQARLRVRFLHFVRATIVKCWLSRRAEWDVQRRLAAARSGALEKTHSRSLRRLYRGAVCRMRLCAQWRAECKHRETLDCALRLQRVARSCLGRVRFETWRRRTSAAGVIQRCFRCRRARSAAGRRRHARIVSDEATCRMRLFLSDMRRLERIERAGLVADAVNMQIFARQAFQEVLSQLAKITLLNCALEVGSPPQTSSEPSANSRTRLSVEWLQRVLWNHSDRQAQLASIVEASPGPGDPRQQQQQLQPASVSLLSAQLPTSDIERQVDAEARAAPVMQAAPARLAPEARGEVFPRVRVGLSCHAADAALATATYDKAMMVFVHVLRMHHVFYDEMLALRWRSRVLLPEPERLRTVAGHRKSEELEQKAAEARVKRSLLHMLVSDPIATSAETRAALQKAGIPIASGPGLSSANDCSHANRPHSAPPAGGPWMQPIEPCVPLAISTAGAMHQVAARECVVFARETAERSVRYGACVTVQRFLRGCLARCQVGRQKMAVAGRCFWKDFAATTIQRRWRGLSTRRDFAVNRSTLCVGREERRRQRAAVTITRWMKNMYTKLEPFLLMRLEARMFNVHVREILWREAHDRVALQADALSFFRRLLDAH
eukprot:gene21028-32401_t